MTADGMVSMLVIAGLLGLYMMLSVYIWFTARELYDKHKYTSISLHCFAVTLLFVFLPLTIYALADMGWIKIYPPTNITEVANITL